MAGRRPTPLTAPEHQNGDIARVEILMFLFRWTTDGLHTRLLTILTQLRNGTTRRYPA